VSVHLSDTMKHSSNWYRQKIRERTIIDLGGECQCLSCPECMMWRKDGKCGATSDLDIDHINPILVGNHPHQRWLREKSWTEDKSNLQLLCKGCHKEKTKKDSVYWMDSKLTRPKQPKDVVTQEQFDKALEAFLNANRR